MLLVETIPTTFFDGQLAKIVLGADAMQLD